MGAIEREATTTAVVQSTSTVHGQFPVATTSSSVEAGSRINHCSVIFNETLYIFGGEATNSSSSSTSTFPLFASLDLNSAFTKSTKDLSWQVLPSTNAVPVLNPECVVTETHFLVVGGQPL